MAIGHRGRHARPGKTQAVITQAVTGGGIAAGIAVTGTGMAQAAPPAAVIMPAAVSHAGPSASHDHHVIIRELAETSVTVQHGDSLSGIAGKHCATPSDWTGIYTANRKTIGGNYNLILPGQKLALDCRNVQLAVQTDAVVTSTQAPASPAPAAGSSGTEGGNLSFSGLERLWESAGGPSWAASSAAAVAECESGGRQYAYNPSGASGYWQILGEVVPGNVFNPMVNAENAVSKFEASGDTWAQWVCKP